MLKQMSGLWKDSCTLFKQLFILKKLLRATETLLTKGAHFTVWALLVPS